MKRHHRSRPGKTIGHDQMAHQKTPLRNPGGIQLQISCLPVHLAQGKACPFRVVGSGTEFLGHLGIPELEIGHIDIHHPIEQSQSRHPFIAAAIVDQRNLQPHFNRQRQGFQNLDDHMGRSDKINIVAPLLLKMHHHAGQLLRRNRHPLTAMADVEILTEKTKKITVRKKDRS